MTRLTVQVARILYGPNATGWCILKTDRGVCKGVVGWKPKDGERLTLEGDWKRSDRTGSNEFDFRAAMLDVPADPMGLLTYAVEITKGIGESALDRIWAAYGPKWQEHPDLDGVAGVTAKARFEWKLTLDRLRDLDAKAQAVAWLIGKGLTMNMAAKAWDKWEGKTIGVVTADPYALCDLPNYGFGHVDKLRAAFGIADADPRRFDAAVVYCMGQLAAEGDTAFNVHELTSKVNACVPPGQFDAAVARLVAAGKVVVCGESVVRAEDWNNESKVWARMGK